MTVASADVSVPGPISLLEAGRRLGTWTRYEDQVFAAVPDDLAVAFTGGTVELEDVDVVHAGGSLDRALGFTRTMTAAERLKRTERFVESLDERQIALVRTIFGPQRRSADARAAEAVRLLDDATTKFVVVDGRTETPDPERTVRIPYANFADRFAGYPVKAQVNGRILATAPRRLGEPAAGLLKTSFLARVPGLSVRVAGKADADFKELLETATTRMPRAVTSRIETLSDAALIEELTAAELVVVPAMAALVDLHLLMMALSFGRPVLVPASPTAKELAAEVGEGWILTYEGPMTAETLDTAILATRSPGRPAHPDLSTRGWEATGRLYAEVFREAVAEVRRDRSVRASIGEQQEYSFQNDHEDA